SSDLVVIAALLVVGAEFQLIARRGRTVAIGSTRDGLAVLVVLGDRFGIGGFFDAVVFQPPAQSMPGGELHDAAQPHMVVRMAGFRVGVIGLLCVCAFKFVFAVGVGRVT